MAVVANKTFPILCFCLGITRTFHPSYTPGECHCNMDVLGRQEKCYKIVTYDFRYPYVHRMAIFSLRSLTNVSV